MKERQKLWFCSELRSITPELWHCSPCLHRETCLPRGGVPDRGSSLVQMPRRACSDAAEEQDGLSNRVIHARSILGEACCPVCATICQKEETVSVPHGRLPRIARNRGAAQDERGVSLCATMPIAR